jgi:hypothetical protein
MGIEGSFVPAIRGESPPRTVEAEIAVLAARQYGVVSRAQLAA